MKVRGAIVIVIALLAPVSAARADHLDGDPATGGFAPTFKPTVDFPQVDQYSGVSLRVRQLDHEEQTDRYEVTIPAGWRFPLASLRESTLAGCKDSGGLPGVPGYIHDSMEAIGSSVVTLQTDATRNPNPDPLAPGQAPGPATYVGGLWFHSWDEGSSTAVLCGYAKTNNTRLVGDPFSADTAPSSDRQMLFEVTMTRAADGSWRLAWDFDAVSGAAPGDRSITDDPTFTAGNVSIIEVNLILARATVGNYHTDPTGRKVPVRFARTPASAGTYRFSATFSPCAAADPGSCDSDTPPLTRTADVPVTLRVPEGFHPRAVIQAPARFSVIEASDEVTLRWAQPDASVFDPVRAYVVVVSPPDPTPQHLAKYHTRYLVTDPEDPAYAASSDPCAPGGASESCALTLAFPLTTGDGTIYGPEGLYSASLVTVFADGHRSDGRCDDGTALGAPAPCADGSVPKIAAPGYAFTEFYLTQDDWPLVYRDVIPRTDGTGPNITYVLLIDFATNRLEFVVWQPLGGATTRRFTDMRVVGANEGLGAIALLDLADGFALEVVVTPADAIGLLHVPTPSALGGYVTKDFCASRISVPIPPSTDDDDPNSQCRIVRVLKGEQAQPA